MNLHIHKVHLCALIQDAVFCLEKVTPAGVLETEAVCHRGPLILLGSLGG